MTLSIDLSDEELEKILLGDRGKDLLMEKVFNQILQAEMTEHLGADRYERSEGRSGHRNGSYERQLTTRVGRLTLEVPVQGRLLLDEGVRALPAVREGSGFGAYGDGRSRRFYPPNQEDHH
jgi:hypothetical protein